MNLKRCLLIFFVLGTILPISADISIQSDNLQLNFADPKEAMGLKSIKRLDDNQVFFENPTNALLWKFDFSGVDNDEYKCYVSNLNTADCSYQFITENGLPTLLLNWENMTVGEEKNALDVTCKIQVKDNDLIMTLLPKLTSSSYTFNTQFFPLLEKSINTATDKILFPRGNMGSRLVNYTIGGLYPSFESQVQFFGVFRGDSGFYMGIHDSGASKKFFYFDQTGLLETITYAENITVANKSSIPPFEVVFAAVNTPYQAAARYKKWAIQQKWTSKGKLKERSDIDYNAGNIGLWANMSGDPAIIKPRFQKEAKHQKSPVAIHWYNWNIHKFDTNYPEFFPGKNGFKVAVKEMQKDGDLVVPYINARLWDVNLPSYKAVGEAGVSMKSDKTLNIEDYGSGVVLGAMCPTYKPYQAKIAEAFDTFVDDYQVKGVYLDQIGAAAPAPCYNSKHGHTLGNGPWWQEGYREMLEPIVKKHGKKVIIATENAAEPYIDTISHFLTWMPVFSDDVPTLTAVYGQYAWYFCSPASAQDSDESFTALMARCLLWNVQPGWLAWLYETDTLTPQMESRRKFIDKIIAFKDVAKEYVVDGELIDEVKFVNPVENQNVEFFRNAMYGGTSQKEQHPTIFGTLWRHEKNQNQAVVIANISGNKVSNEIKLDTANFALYRLYSNGRKVKCKDLNFELEPYECAIFIMER